MRGSRGATKRSLSVRRMGSGTAAHSLPPSGPLQRSEGDAVSRAHQGSLDASRHCTSRHRLHSIPVRPGSRSGFLQPNVVAITVVSQRAVCFQRTAGKSTGTGQTSVPLSHRLHVRQGLHFTGASLRPGRSAANDANNRRVIAPNMALSHLFNFRQPLRFSPGHQSSCWTFGIMTLMLSS